MREGSIAENEDNKKLLFEVRQVLPWICKSTCHVIFPQCPKMFF